MRTRAALIVLILALFVPALAQMKMSVPQLKAFLESSAKLNHDDRKVAQYLEQLDLSQKLDEDAYIELLALGIGDRTARALRVLMDKTRDLPAPTRAVEAPRKPTIPAPSPDEQRKLIERVREYALGYTANLPDFICTQVARRYVDPAGLEFWQHYDTVTTKLTFFDQKEEYTVMLVNDRPRVGAGSLEELDGSVSQGEFGTMMKEIFDPASEARFQWLRWATLAGKRTHVIGYSITQTKSKFTVTYNRSDSVVPAYSGLIYVDPQTRAVRRITMDAEAMPPSFPIQQVGQQLDYDRVDISGETFMLPRRFTTRMREGKLLAKNEVEFRLYRKFEADASIVFDEGELDEQDPIGETPREEPVP